MSFPESQEFAPFDGGDPEGIFLNTIADSLVAVTNEVVQLNRMLLEGEPGGQGVFVFPGEEQQKTVLLEPVKTDSGIMRRVLINTTFTDVVDDIQWMIVSDNLYRCRTTTESPIGFYRKITTGVRDKGNPWITSPDLGTIVNIIDGRLVKSVHNDYNLPEVQSVSAGRIAVRDEAIPIIARSFPSSDPSVLLDHIKIAVALTAELSSLPLATKEPQSVFDLQDQ